MDDVLTQEIWTQYFLKEQVYEIRDNVIYQYIQSKKKLENNDRQSSIKRTRKNNIRYYFITDRITKEEASMELCPTLGTIRDYFTKALQGYKFRRFRNIIFGIHEDDITSYNASGWSFLEEKKIKLYKEKEEAKKAAKLAGDWGNQGVCWGELFYELPMHAQHAQEGTLLTNILCCTRIFHVYIVWCQLTQL